jgi:hypothetical protein
MSMPSMSMPRRSAVPDVARRRSPPPRAGEQVVLLLTNTETVRLDAVETSRVGLGWEARPLSHRRQRSFEADSQPLKYVHRSPEDR